MSIFQSIEALAKKLTSPKDLIVDSSQTGTNALNSSLKPVEISSTSISEKRSIDDEYLLGLENKNNGSFLQAIEFFKSVENNSPGYREVYALLQETYELAAIKEITDKNYIAALLLLKKSQALSSSDKTTARLISHKAFCEHHSGHPQLSIDSYKKAVQICRDVVMDCYGTQLIELGWESIVAQEDKKSLRDEAEQYYWKGFKSKSTPEKLGLYKKAIDLCSDYVEAYYSLGCLYIIQSDFDNAVPILKKVFCLNSAHENISYILATLFLNQSNYSESIPYLEKAISLQKPPDKLATLYADLAFCRKHVEDITGAINALIESFKIDPKVAYDKYESSFEDIFWDQCIESSQTFDSTKYKNINQFLAEQYWKHGFRVNNPHYYKKALEFNPQYAQAHYSLGCLYKKNGEIQEALKYLQLANQCQPGFKDAYELINSLRVSYNSDIIAAYDKKPQNQEVIIEKLKADNRSELLNKENIIAELQLKVNQLSQKASDDSVLLNEYERKVQSSEKLLQSLKTSYFSELSNKDKEIEVSQQKTTQLSNEVETLKATFTNERQHLNAIIDDLKQQLENAKYLKTDTDLIGIQQVADIDSQLIIELQNDANPDDYETVPSEYYEDVLNILIKSDNNWDRNKPSEITEEEIDGDVRRLCKKSGFSESIICNWLRIALPEMENAIKEREAALEQEFKEQEEARVNNRDSLSKWLHSLPEVKWDNGQWDAFISSLAQPVDIEDLVRHRDSAIITYDEYSVKDLRTGLIWHKQTDLINNLSAPDLIYEIVTKLRYEHLSGYATWRFPTDSELAAFNKRALLFELPLFHNRCLVRRIGKIDLMEKEETIIDYAEGMEWLKNDCKVLLRNLCLDDAMEYVKELSNESYLGYSDWRLPTRNEIENILEYYAMEYLNDICEFKYWTSSPPLTTYNPNYRYVASVTKTESESERFVSAIETSFMTMGKTTLNHVWPVRSVTQPNDNKENRCKAAKVSMTSNYFEMLSPEELSVIKVSSVWSEFKISSSPRTLISNYLWEKFRSDLLSTKYGQSIINHLTKQLFLPSIVDTKATVNSFLAHPLYHFLSTTVGSDIDTVILCITALMVLVDAQQVDNVNEQPVLPTVAEPSNNVHNFVIPRPPENSVPLQQPPPAASVQVDIQPIQLKRAETNRVSWPLHNIFTDENAEPTVVYVTEDDRSVNIKDTKTTNTYDPPEHVAGILDMNQIQLKKQETEAVSVLLRDIFTDEDDAPPIMSITNNQDLLNLDEIHSAFLSVLTTKDVWRRDELEKLASGKRLLLEGVLHTINEEIYETYGEPLFEDEDPIELNMEIVRQILGKES